MWIRYIRQFIIGLLATGLLAALVYSLYFAFQVKEIQQMEGKLTLQFFDVGQGDSTLIVTPYGQRILVDGGPDNTISDKLASSIPFFDKRIDMVVLTHPHADHVTGLVNVLEEYQVQTVIHTGVIHTIEAYANFLHVIKEKDIRSEIIEHPRIFELFPPQGEEGDPVVLQFLYPLHSFVGERVENLNNTSIVMRVVYQDTSVLLTGDAEIPVQEDILSAWKKEDLKSDVLKVPHQGSSDATFDAFMAAVQPTYAVIFAGKDNTFGHPHQAMLNLLKKYKAIVLRTDERGDISFTSDGQHILPD